ncbi:poly-gamma-glutamate hydrolase family protein [Bacillus glycinifermentans]|uniref:poly-gamma-glutamate hydrolase family protein n=1 Tax=Bacillus glycinifermentans TaxID=1664069 RepID=UPI003A523071
MKKKGKNEEMNRASADRYANFKELSQKETEGVDYSVFKRNAGKGLLVMSPHGGGIEPGISEIVRAFADDRTSVYLFEGIKSRGNRDLHVTSACFDDPLAVKMAADHQYVLAFHGYFEPSHCHTLVGGTDRKRAAIFVNALRRHGFSAELQERGARFSGTSPESINNRCKTGLSVQFEISTAQRKAMFGRFSLKGRDGSQNEVFHQYINAVKEGAAAAYGRA